jgi:hypothetical protein
MITELHVFDLYAINSDIARRDVRNLDVSISVKREESQNLHFIMNCLIGDGEGSRIRLGYRPLAARKHNFIGDL